ncbi:MAG: IPTL-CTERM sorting domain-containing protein, partial [Haliea sp.]
MLLVAGAPAVGQTYAATGGNYTVFADFTAPCGVGACANFLNTMSASGTFTTAAPLPANLVAQPIRPLITAFRFTDGLTTY